MRRFWKGSLLLLCKAPFPFLLSPPLGQRHFPCQQPGSLAITHSHLARALARILGATFPLTWRPRFFFNLPPTERGSFSPQTRVSGPTLYSAVTPFCVTLFHFSRDLLPSPLVQLSRTTPAPPADDCKKGIYVVPYRVAASPLPFPSISHAHTSSHFLLAQSFSPICPSRRR